MHKKKYKPYKDPEMKEVKLVVAISLVAFVVGSFILASPEINIVIPEFNLIPLAYAQIQDRGYDWLDTDYGNGTSSLQAGLPPYVFANNTYWPYVLGEDANSYNITTGSGTLIYSKTGCGSKFYNSTGQLTLDSESTIVHQKDLTTNSTWEYITDVNNANCEISIFENPNDNSITLTSMKSSSELATFTTKYIKNSDVVGWKVLLSVTNDNPAWTNNTMGFIETIHVPDTITLGGIDYYIPDNNGTFFDHNYFNNTFSTIYFGNNQYYRTDNGLVNLWGSTLIYENGTSKITFDYSFNDIATPVGEAYEIDPTFVSGGSQRGVGDNDGDNICEDTGSAAYIDDGSANMFSHGDLAVNAPLLDCLRAALTVDISSIPNTVQSVDDITITLTPSIIRTAQNHFFFNMPVNAQTLTDAQFFDQVNSGQQWANALVNSNPEIVDLGTTTGKSDLLTILQTDSQEFISIGISQNGIASGIETGFDNAGGTLTIVYTEAIIPQIQLEPMNVTATTNRDNKIVLNWDIANGTGITNYDIFNSTTGLEPFQLLTTIGNFTTFTDSGLPEKFEMHYKVGFNPNSTIVFGMSGNPFVNDTQITKEQFLWIGNDLVSAFIQHSPRQAGAGATCAAITGPASATDAASATEVLHPDTSDALGCIIGKTYTLDRETSTQKLLPIFLDDHLIGIDLLNDIQTSADTNFSFRCRYMAVSDALGVNIDPRLNITAAYEVLEDSTKSENLSGGFVRCISSNAQRPELSLGGTTDYLNSMASNSSFYSFGKIIEIDDRDAGTTDHSLNAETNMRFGFTNPTWSKVWNIQEHPKFDDNSLIAAKAKTNSLGKFNLNTNSDLTDRGQIVTFKEFNKTQVGINDIRVSGSMQADTSTPNLHLRIEIKDGGFAMGNTIYFPQNEYDAYPDPTQQFDQFSNKLVSLGGSLGAIHLNPQSLGVEPFDVSFIPNWANSTEDIFTVFIGIDDNSTLGGLSANLTLFEINNVVALDFEDLLYTEFYESTCSTECDDGAASFLTALVEDGLEARNFYNEGITHTEQIATSGVTGLALPSPNAATNFVITLDHYDTIGLTWNHDFVNATGVKIERDNGSGFVTIAQFDTPLIDEFVDANQLDPNKVRINSLSDATGLDENTTYTYRIIVLNGASQSTPTTSISITTPDSFGFWDLKEHDAESLNQSPIMHVEQTGGDTANWLSVQDAGELGAGDGRNSQFIFKSFDVTEMGINFETDFQMFIETQCDGVGGGACTGSDQGPSAFTQTILHGKFNRYSAELFPNGSSAINSPVNVTNTVTSRGGGGASLAMGGGTIFDPQHIRYSPNVKEVLESVNPNFITIMFRWDANLFDASLDLENFTVTNSTTFNFKNTIGNNVILNFTADDTNCQLQDGGLTPITFDPVIRTSADECDSGTVFVPSISHLENKLSQNVTSDWQFKELHSSGSTNGWSYWEFHSNATGLIINTTDAFVNNSPSELGKFFLFKTFTPLSATTQVNMTIQGENNPAGALEFVSLKSTELIGDSQLNGRWNSTSFESDVLEKITSIVGTVNSPAVPFAEQNVAIAIDTSSFIGTPISIVITARDNTSARDATLIIKDITIGGTAYNFANAVVRFDGDSEGTTGELGLISAGTVTLQPSPIPDLISSVTATATLPNVLVEWVHTQGNTTDYSIDRALLSGWGTSLATLNQNFKPTNATQPMGIHLSPDGTKMFIVNTQGFGGGDPDDYIDEYNLSTAFDPSTSTWINTLDVNSQNTSPVDVWFKPDGLKMYMLGTQNDSVFEYDLTSAFNISSAIHSGNFIDVTSESLAFNGMFIRADGKKMFLASNSPDNISDYDLSIAFDITTAVLNQTVAFSGCQVNDVFFKPDGDVMLLQCGPTGTDTIDRYTLDYFNIQTTVFTNELITQTVGQDSLTEGMYVNDAGTLMYLVGRTNKQVEEYNLSGGTFAQLVPSMFEAVNGATFFDDFSTDRGWLSGDPSTIFIDTNSGTLNYTDVDNDGLSRITLNIDPLITGGINENLFSIRTSFTQVTDSGTGTPEVVIAGLGEQNATATAGIDYCSTLANVNDSYCLFYRSGGHNQWQIFGQNSTDGANSNLKLGFDQGLGVTVYPEIVVDNGFLRATVYSDAAYTNILNGDVTTTVSLNAHIQTNNLKHLMFGEMDNISVGSGDSGFFDYVAFWNNVNVTAEQPLPVEWLDTTVDRATTYQYRVTPSNEIIGFGKTVGTGVVSNNVLTNDVPAQVTNLVANYISKTQVSLDWDDTTNLGEGSPASPPLTLVEYRIYDQDLGTPPFILTGIQGISQFIDLENFPQEVEYKVSACNEIGCGTNSTIAQALGFPLSVPVLSASGNVPLGINATWTMSNQVGVTGFTLYNSSDNITFGILTTVGNSTSFFFDTPHPVCFEQFYKVSAFTVTQNGTNSTTAFGTVDCVFSPIFTTPPTLENIGDTYKLFGSGTFSGGNLTQIELLENGTATDTNSTIINFTTGPTQTLNFDYLFWERETVGGVRNFTVAVSGQSPIFNIDTVGSSVFATSEYDPRHRDAIVESQGQVNFTHFRFADENEISLRVNRIQVPSGETWQIECIYQTVQEAIDTKDSIVPEEPTVRWVGTFDNATNVGFFNSTFLGASGQHIYISCFNDLLLFSTTSFTNSSLALFGIQALDTSFGSLIGIPSGIFMLVLMAGMANKRTSPTWIIVVTGAAGMMSVIGFFTLEPIVWGLALITAMLGMFVNQKVF